MAHSLLWFCPNINCLPSKNEIWSAKVAHLVHHAAQYGTVTGAVATDMASLRLHWPEYLMETGSPRELLLRRSAGTVADSPLDVVSDRGTVSE